MTAPGSRCPNRRVKEKAALVVSMPMMLLTLATLSLASASLAACSGTSTSAVPAKVAWSTPGPSSIPAFYNPPNPTAQGAPGTLVRTQQVTGVPGIPPDATLWRILYHSRDISNRDILVSGYIVVPTAPPPPGGRPIVTWSHGTTGTARICAPSLFSNAADASGKYLPPDLAQYIAAGYVVTATDYQGLGGPGIHPYLVGKAEGQDVLDAVRAARHLPGAHTSGTVVIVGHSQGGHAALFAGQLASSYAPELRVVATVAIAPLTETAEALPLAIQVGETSLLATAAYAWAHTYSDLPMGTLFEPGEITTVDRLMSSTCEEQVGKSLRNLPAAALFQPGFASSPALNTHLVENSPGAVHTASPILLLQGTADTTIPDVLAEQFEKTQCPAVDDNLQLVLYPGAGHGTVLIASKLDMLTWIQHRIAGMPLTTSGCTVTPAH